MLRILHSFILDYTEVCWLFRNASAVLQFVLELVFSKRKKHKHHCWPQDEVDGHFFPTQMNKYYVPIVFIQQSHSPFRVNTRNPSVIKELLEILASLLSLKLKSSYHTMIKRYKILSFFQISHLWVWTLFLLQSLIFGLVLKCIHLD